MTALDHYNSCHREYVQYCLDDVLQAAKPDDANELLGFIGHRANIANKKVLDLGSGMGYPAWYFSINFGCSVLGLNICEKQLKRSLKKYGNVAHFKNFDFDELDKLKYNFDVALMLESIGHSKDLDKLFTNLYDKVNSVFIKHVYVQDKSRVEEFEDFYGYKNYSFFDIIKAATKANFELESVEYLPFVNMKPNKIFIAAVGAPNVPVQAKYMIFNKGV